MKLLFAEGEKMRRRIGVVFAIAIVMASVLTACVSTAELNSEQHTLETNVSTEEPSLIDETKDESAVDGEVTEDDICVTTESEEEKPTGYASDEIQAELIFVNDRLYVNAPVYADDDDISNDGHLPTGYERVGEVTHVENKEEPDQDYEAAHVEIGTEIYVNASEPEYIYVKYTDPEHYRRFTLASEVTAWWR